MLLKEAITALENDEIESFEYSGRVFRKGDINNAVSNPKPRTEEREVKRWLVYRKDTGELQCGYSTHRDALDWMPTLTLSAQMNLEIVEMTGTLHVELPRKEKKRVEITTADLTGGRIGWREGTKFFAEWEE